MLDEGLAREVINRIQKLRKKAKLLPSDDITVFYKATGALCRIIPAFEEFIFATIKQPLILWQTAPAGGIIIQENTKIKENSLELIIVRGQVKGAVAASSNLTQKAPNGPGPFCKYVNVELAGSSRQATFLLENPKGEYPISFSQLMKQVKHVMGIEGSALRLYRSQDKSSELTTSSFTDISNLNGVVLYAFTGNN
jgi:isoleucyl-tRNA synthetase